jgi:solute carrier family 25 aspartate/glutamate transporter 12/13
MTIIQQISRRYNKDVDMSFKLPEFPPGLLPGLISGSIGAFAVYPIDVIKTRMQNQNIKLNKLYNNGFDCSVKLWRDGGIRSFYRGSIPQMLGVGPEKAIKFVGYNYVINKMDKTELKTHIYGGLFAGTCQVLITSPYEMIKINMQMNNKIDYNKFLLSIYKGASACFLRDIPFSGIYFPTYWYLREVKELNIFISGLLAGIPSAFLCTPADVIKTRLQTFNNDNKSILSLINKIYLEEGYNAFFKGGGWRVLRSSPQFGVTLLTYENIKSNFNLK